MDRKTKAFTGKIRYSPTYTGEIMHVGAAPNKENNKELVVNNPKQNLEAKYFNRNFDPPIIKLQV